MKRKIIMLLKNIVLALLITGCNGSCSGDVSFNTGSNRSSNNSFQNSPNDKKAPSPAHISIEPDTAKPILMEQNQADSDAIKDKELQSAGIPSITIPVIKGIATPTPKSPDN